MNKSPYSIVKRRYITEKASTLSALQNAESNKSVRRCEAPKAVFLVSIDANKQEIAWAIEKIYAKNNVKVTAVNTIIVKPKPRLVRGTVGKTRKIKKAIVTFEKGDRIDEEV